MKSRAAEIAGWWQRLHRLPGGRWLFGRVIGFTIPYTGSVRPLIQEIRPGYARVVLRDRRRVRNHLHSIHALALANVGEFTGGIAMTSGLPPDVRSILLRLEIEYLKKARGTVTAECDCTVPTVTTTMDHRVQTVIRDGAGDDVARVTATWRLSPVQG